MILPRYSATIFYKLQASQGWYQMSKLKGNKFARSENVFQRGRPKVRNSRFLAFLRHLGHHFQKLWLAAAESNYYAPRLRAAPHVALLAALVGTPSCYTDALRSLTCLCLALLRLRGSIDGFSTHM